MALIRVPRKQHTVSRVVLRRFAWRERLAVYDRDKDVLGPKAPGGAFWTEHFDGHDPLGAEERAGAIESRIPKVLQQVDRRTVLDDRDAIAALIDLMALHWARSPALRLAHERIKAAVIEDSKHKYAGQDAVRGRAFTQRTGLHATSPSELAWINDKLHDIAPAVAEQWWSDRSTLNFESARDIMGRHKLQVGYFDDPLLVIGDAPVIVRDSDATGYGPHQGIALGDAAEICMPISPTVLIALGPESRAVKLESSAAERFNEMQVRSFVRWLGARPLGQADSWIRARLQPSRTYELR